MEKGESTRLSMNARAADKGVGAQRADRALAAEEEVTKKKSGEKRDTKKRINAEISLA